MTGGLNNAGGPMADSSVLLGPSWSSATSMPESMVDHCMVMIDPTTVMVIGGNWATASNTVKTYIMNTTAGGWKVMKLPCLHINNVLT
jgi:hypothetical protein